MNLLQEYGLKLHVVWKLHEQQSTVTTVLMIDTSSGSAFDPLVIWGTILLSVKITTTSNSLHQFTAAIFTLYNITTFLGKHKANWYQKWPKMCQAVHCSMPSINLFRLLFYLQILQIQIVYLPRSLQSVSVTQPNNPIIQSCLSSFHIQHNLWWWHHRLCSCTLPIQLPVLPSLCHSQFHNQNKRRFCHLFNWLIFKPSNLLGSLQRPTTSNNWIVKKLDNNPVWYPTASERWQTQLEYQLGKHLMCVWQTTAEWERCRVDTDLGSVT